MFIVTHGIDIAASTLCPAIAHQFVNTWYHLLFVFHLIDVAAVPVVRIEETYVLIAGEVVTAPCVVMAILVLLHCPLTLLQVVDVSFFHDYPLIGVRAVILFRVMLLYYILQVDHGRDERAEGSQPECNPHDALSHAHRLCLARLGEQHVRNGIDGYEQNEQQTHDEENNHPRVYGKQLRQIQFSQVERQAVEAGCRHRENSDE